MKKLSRRQITVIAIVALVLIACMVSRSKKNDPTSGLDTAARQACDDFAAGYRIIMRMEYNQLLFDWTFKPQIVWSHDVKGIAISPAQNFIEGTMLWQVGTDIEVNSQINLQVFYQGWADGGSVNGYRDKDFAGFAASYTF